MKLSLPGKYNTKIVKAIAEFNLINDGDHILLGLSGGKDSSFMAYALTVLRKHLAIDFQLSAITIDPGFKENDFSYLEALCDRLEIPYHIEQTRIADYILSVDSGTPCAKCAHFRRGALIQYMKRNGFKKLAFGHHYDDAVETFLMSILYSGQILALQPLRYLSDNDIYIIRPLIYLREKLLKDGEKLIDYQIKVNQCPFNNKTKRAEIKKELKRYTHNKQIFYNLAAAMKKGAPLELWPEELEEEELYNKMQGLFGKNK